MDSFDILFGVCGFFFSYVLNNTFPEDCLFHFWLLRHIEEKLAHFFLFFIESGEEPVDLTIINNLLTFHFPYLILLRKYLVHTIMQLIRSIPLYCQYLLKVLTKIKAFYVHHFWTGKWPENVVEVEVERLQLYYPTNLRKFCHNGHPIMLSYSIAKHAWVRDHMKKHTFLEADLEGADNSGGPKLLPKTAYLINFIANIIFAFKHK